MNDQALLRRVVIKENVPSRYLDEPRSVAIALPPGYDERISGERDLSFLEIYMVAGLQEERVELPRGVFHFLEMNQITNELLRKRGAKVRYGEKQSGHQWGFWQRELPEALQYFFAGSG